MSGAYTPRPGGLPALVCEYLRRNPGAELTAGQIADLFDVPNTNVRSALMPAIAAGALARRQDEHLCRWTYCAGPRLDASLEDEDPPVRSASAALQQALASAWR